MNCTDDLVRAGLKAMLVRAHREEMQQRLERTAEMKPELTREQVLDEMRRS